MSEEESTRATTTKRTEKPLFTKVYNFVIILILAAVSFALRHISAPDLCGSHGCLGPIAVLRVTFPFAIVFALMMFLSLCGVTTSNCCLRFLSLILTVVLVGGSFALPAVFYESILIVFQIFGGIFLVFQTIALIEFAYSLNMILLNKGWKAFILFLAFGGLFMSLAGIVLLYVFYSVGSAGNVCAHSIVAITATLLLTTGCVVLSLWAPHGALLTSAIVTINCVFTCYSALSSQPIAWQCQPTSSNVTITVLASILSLGMLVWTSVSVASANVFGGKSERSPRAAAVYFFFILTLAAFYLAMIVNHWVLDSTGTQFSVGNGATAMGIKFGSLGLTLALYAWTLVAPKACPRRDFGVDTQVEMV